jgi:hypothetical protein
MRWSPPACPLPLGGALRPSAVGISSTITPPSRVSARRQSSQAMSPWARGSTSIWPTEPPAVTMPRALLRTDSGTCRPTAPMAMEMDVADAPMPTTSPVKIVSTSGLEEWAIP